MPLMPALSPHPDLRLQARHHLLHAPLPPRPFPPPPHSGLRLWHKLDTTFCMPRVSAMFRLSSPLLSASPRAAALLHLLLKLCDDELTEDAYLADVAGLHYHLSPEGVAGTCVCMFCVCL